MLEFVRVKGQSRLLRWRSNRARISEQFVTADAVYEPLALDAATLAAIRFPGGTACYGSVGELFGKILDALCKYCGLPAPELRPVPYWVLASWFPELLPTLPTLVVTGPSPAAARKFLRLLRCFCRRGVVLTELTPGGFLTLPLYLRPTILLEEVRLKRQTRALLRAASNCSAYVPRAGELMDLRCLQAIYCADDIDAEGQEMLRVSLFPAADKIPAFDTTDEEKLGQEFQPQLLQYRMEKFLAVAESAFDAPGFTPGVRELARSLAAPVVGDQNLTAGVMSLLSDQDKDIRTNWATLPDFAIVVALLALVHEQKEKRVSVMKITECVNATLRASGEIKDYSPVEIGRLLSRLRFPRSRSAGGMFIALNRQVSRRAHDLKRRYGVTTSPASIPRCPDCEIAEAPGNRLIV